LASVPKPRRKKKAPQAGESILARSDKLWSLIVRSKGYCEVRQWFPHVCKGPLQAMHGIPRTYKATRWNLLNGFSGCAGCHLYLTWHPEEWSRYLVKAWGPEVFEELWVVARKLAKPDAPTILASLEYSFGVLPR
jgi:hypothetical protein